MSWTAGGVANSGFLQEAGRARSRHPPAVAAHRGRLWCLWSDLSGHLWYAATTEDGRDFERREPFPFSQTGLPVVASVSGELHAIIVQDSGRMTHYCRDADDWLGWERIGSLASSTDTMPALVAFHNQLFLAYVWDNALYCMKWNPLALRWAEPILVGEGGQLLFDAPGLCVLERRLHLVCTSGSERRDALAYTFDEATNTWERASDVFEGKLALGASCTSYGDTVYMGFTGENSSSREHKIYVARYNSGTWFPNESVADVEAAETPQIAILNGRIHVIFTDNTPTRDLRWFSRSILEYSPASWMANIPDETLLSNMTIPGTHDSCARSTIPFVKTQNLSVTQQLAMGIRFFDFRLRLHRDGKLYCYHGGIPLGWPRVMSFESVMDEIWAFLRPSRSPRLPPTETVLISINNDNPSRGANNTPEIFYEAIAAAIDDTPPYPDGTARWIVEPHTPRLGDVRGRAVLLRRYHGHPAIKPTLRHGIDLSAWINDSPDFTIITPTGVVVRLQDKWKYTERIGLQELVASKSAYVQAMMVRAVSSRPSTPAIEEFETDSSDEDDVSSVDGYVVVRRRNHAAAAAGPTSSRDVWFVNFCSAVGDPSEHGEVAQARWVAVGGFSNSGEWIDGVNVMTSDYLREQQQGVTGRKRLGIVPMDYPELPQDNDLVSKLIETNLSD